MRLYVGLTDRQWFDYLAALNPEEVNFWRPGGNSAFRALVPGEPFLFKLHSPHHYIVGGGLFAHFTQLPLSLAWDLFGRANGAADRGALWHNISRRREDTLPDPTIGCVILSQPFFLEPDEWIPVPPSWSPSIQQGKGYSTDQPDGMGLWQSVRDRLASRQAAAAQVHVRRVTENEDRYRTPQVVEPRLGQGGFRARVTDAYQRRCAVTGERVLPVLEAAHIKDYAECGPNRVENGILLRADLHNRFDRGYVTVTPELRVVVSGRMREEFHNGREYQKLHGQPLVQVPSHAIERPSAEYLRWHNEHRYRG